VNRTDALAGCLIADAASMGLHWMYDQEQIETIANSGDVLFRQPDAAIYQDKKGFFAHAVKHTGELSHYGESARIVGQLASDGRYNAAKHREKFMAAFGPCGHYSGYADRPTKALIARIITEGDDINDPSGMSDNQMPALCVVPGLFAFEQSADTIANAVKIISIHEEVVSGANAVHHCLELLNEGKSLPEALSTSASTMGGDIGQSMHDALAIEQYQPLEAAQQFGLACYVKHALPVVWHLLQHANDFESVVRDNIRCGGDNCGRAMALGAIAGLAFGVPDAMIDRMAEQRVPINW